MLHQNRAIRAITCCVDVCPIPSMCRFVDVTAGYSMLLCRQTQRLLCLHFTLFVQTQNMVLTRGETLILLIAYKIHFISPLNCNVFAFLFNA
jgi:hypothetical protein